MQNTGSDIYLSICLHYFDITAKQTPTNLAHGFTGQNYGWTSMGCQLGFHKDLNQDVSWAGLLSRGSEKESASKSLRWSTKFFPSGLNNEILFPCWLSAKIALCS